MSPVLNVDMADRVVVETYLADCEKRGLARENWAPFLTRWFLALTAAGGNPAITSDTTYSDLSWQHGNGSSYPGMVVVAPGYANKDMAKVPRYEPTEVPEVIGQYYDGACNLCHAVAQALDAEIDHSVPSNALYLDERYLLTPNICPAHPGQSVFIPLDHDDLTDRVLGETVDGCHCFRPVHGKFLGKVRPREYLMKMMELADKHNLLVLGNHPVDGMSIWSHLHEHMIPVDVPLSRYFIGLLENLSVSGWGANLFHLTNSPYDTLVYQGDHNSIANFASPVFESLEGSHEVYTLIYHMGKLAITPRVLSVHKAGRWLGANVGLHARNVPSAEFVHSSTIEDTSGDIPPRGSFPWKRHIADSN